MRTQYISCSGCMLYVLLAFVLLFFLKFAWLIILIVLLILLSRGFTIRRLFKSLEPKEYEPKEGEVYKQCSYCGAKAPRNAKNCPKCSHPFEV